MAAMGGQRNEDGGMAVVTRIHRNSDNSGKHTTQDRLKHRLRKDDTTRHKGLETNSSQKRLNRTSGGNESESMDVISVLHTETCP